MLTAYIGLGANLPSPAGPPAATLAAAAVRLSSLGRIAARSSLYSTVPVGLANQPRFVNAVVAIETTLPPHDLLNALLAIERDFGRDRPAGILNGPRTLDLDILLMGDLEVSEPGLAIPHPRLAGRAFALVPLNEVAPAMIVAGHRKTVAQLLHALLESRKEEADAVAAFQSEIWPAGHEQGDALGDTGPAARGHAGSGSL